MVYGKKKTKKSLKTTQEDFVVILRFRTYFRIDIFVGLNFQLLTLLIFDQIKTIKINST